MKIAHLNDLRHYVDLNIFEITNRVFSTLTLLRIDENVFQIIQNGTYQPLITNANYILIDKKYRELLSRLPEQVILKDATIIHRSENIRNDNYVELSFFSKISLDSKKTELLNCMQIWEYFSSIIISESLKNEFLKIDENDFDFLIGLPLMVG